MNFNLANNNKWVIIFTVFAVIILGSIGFAVAQTYSVYDAARKDIKKAEAQLEELQNINKDKASLESKIKFTKAEFDSYSHKLPKLTYQEGIVDMLRDYGDKTKLNILDIALSPPENTDAGTKVLVKIGFAGTYTQIADFFGAVNSNLQKTAVPQMTISGKGNKLTGSASILLYSYKESSFDPPPWNPVQPAGKSDLFKLFSGAPSADTPEDTLPGITPETAGVPQTKNSPYDLFVVSGPTTDDAPTTVMGKNNVAGSEIFADGKEDNWANIFITEKDGKVFYRYRTNFSEYPDNNKTEEFIPVINGKVVVKVTAKPKTGVEDRAGTLLNIYNYSSREVVVKINRQTGIPRASVVQKKGPVTTVYE